ncbi:MAG: 50S ribosomal protein L5, partial [Pseudomonadota bacterium]
MADTQTYTPRVKAVYHGAVRGKLQERFNYANVMQIPEVTKVVINMGVGEAVGDSKKPARAAEDLYDICVVKALLQLAANSAVV